MKLVLTSAQFLNNQLSVNIKNLQEISSKYHNKDIDFICFGEAYLQGFDGLTWNINEDINRAISIEDKVITDLQEYSKINNIGNAFGYIEKDSGKLYSSYIVIDKNGEILANYRRISQGWKVQEADPTVYLHNSSKTVFFNYEGKKIGLGLCGDFWEHPGIYADLEADLYIWPVFIDYTKKEWEEGAQKEYADQALLVGKNVAMINSVYPNQAYGGATYFVDGNIEAYSPMESYEDLIIEFK
ncbi:carbon-nitrogen hydrolase family protein [Floricoccus penangensis]|uniref:carbon-nitrogen hydrolase family protein n=1 Tax=Floricoccus penangensis TaxID=1859475 RepID=UPI002041A416|nr:carbon-nitrogen hydrolase family protein [Floricoccus penangensis]URZ86927.1 carbon-nitrogen hydrolase family protein [Floricoccus penangensis]